MLDAYEEYERFCTSLRVTPCTFDDWQISIALLDGQHIPYTSSTGTLANKVRMKDGSKSVF